MSPDYFVVERSVYKLGDWLNEIGGFYTALYIIFFLLMYVFRSHNLNQYLVEKLYLQQDPLSQPKKGNWQLQQQIT